MLVVTTSLYRKSAVLRFKCLIMGRMRVYDYQREDAPLHMQIGFVLMYYYCITGLDLKENSESCNLYHP